MLNRVLVRVVLAAVVAGLLVADVVGLATVGGGGTAVSADSSPSSTGGPGPGSGPASDRGPAGPGALDPAAGPATVAPATSGTTTARPTAGSGTTAAPSVARPGGAASTPGPTTAPAVGTYTYDTQSTEGNPPTVSSSQDPAVVRGAGTENGAVKQQDGQPLAGVPTTNTVVWAAGGVTVEHTTISFAEVTVECQWSAPFTQYGANLHVGSTWSVDASCSGQTTIAQCGGLVGFNVHQTGTAKVTGAEVVVVGGVATPVWDISRSPFAVDVNASTAGLVKTCTISLQASVQEREQFAADRGLPVTRDDQGTTTATFNGQPFSTTAHSVSTLRSLTPA
jgi:hypothetical protein